MPLTIGGQVGPTVAGDNTYPPVRLGRTAEVVVGELHGRFFEQVSRGNVYSIGTAGVLALTANTIGLTATGTPILGIYNPPTSGYTAVVLQATLVDFLNNVTSVALGAFVWASSIGNNVVTTGLAPFNRKTLSSTGSQVKGFGGATAMTGLTTTLVVFEPAEFNTASGLLTTTVAAATPTPSVSGVQNFDGSLFVPPGGMLGLFNTISVTTHSVWGRLMWEEVPNALIP